MADRRDDVVQPGERKLIFRDHQTAGRLLTSIVALSIVVWMFFWFQLDFDVLIPNTAAIVAFFVLLLLLPLRGRLYDTRHVEWLEIGAAGLEGRTQQTIGSGRRIAFKPSDVTWRGLNDIEPMLLVRIGRKEYSLNIKTAQLFDREAFLALAPQALAAAEAPRDTKGKSR